MKYYYPHITFFIVFMVAVIPVLYYYQRKNPNPRCRPHFGEMTMVTIVAMMLCGGMAAGLGSLFKPENDGSGLRKKPDEGAGWSVGAGNSEEKERSGERRRAKDTGDVAGGGFQRND